MKRVDTIQDVTFSPDGKTLASINGHGVYLWDANTGQHRTTLWGRTGNYATLAFSADGTTVAVPRIGDGIHIWDVHTEQLHTTLEGPTSETVALAFWPDNQNLVRRELCKHSLMGPRAVPCSYPLGCQRRRCREHLGFDFCCLAFRRKFARPQR